MKTSGLFLPAFSDVGKDRSERGEALARLFSEDAACHCERDADRTVDVDRTGARRHLVGDPLAAVSAIDNLAGVCADELSPNVEALADERTVAQQLLADCVEFGEAIELPVECAAKLVRDEHDTFGGDVSQAAGIHHDRPIVPCQRQALPLRAHQERRSAIRAVWTRPAAARQPSGAARDRSFCSPDQQVSDPRLRPRIPAQGSGTRRRARVA